MAQRIAAFINKIGGDTLDNPYTFNLRPTEIVLLQALEKHRTIDTKKMGELDINSIRVQISRLRRKLPRGVTIQALYGGYYFMSPEAKVILSKHRRNEGG